MLDHRIPRRDGEILLLNSIPCQVVGNAVIQEDVIAYPARVSGLDGWNDILIRELYPRSLDASISRSQSGVLQCTADGKRLLAEKREVFLRGQRVEQQQFNRLPPEVGAKSFCCDAYGTSYAVRIIPRSATCETLLEQNPNGLPMEEAVSLILKLLDILEDIHSSGLLHLNILPSSIHLLPGGALVLDYIQLWDQKTVDLPENLGYSLSYAAPELRLHNWNEIGPSTDLYAATALFYHLIFGHGPQQDPLIGLPQYNALPVPLARMFHKGLHLLPRRRFATAAELRMTLLLLERQGFYRPPEMNGSTPFRKSTFEKKRSEQHDGLRTQF